MSGETVLVNERNCPFYGAFMYRNAPGGILGGALPLTIDYEAETVEGLMGGEYEIEVAK